MLTIHIQALTREGAVIGRDTHTSTATTSKGRARAFDAAMKKAARLWPDAHEHAAHTADGENTLAVRP